MQIPVETYTLPNGLRVILSEDHATPIVAVNLWYHVGSGDERPGRTGFAHLFEHLMFMGSKHAPYPQFDRLLEAAGAGNNGSTTTDRTNYYESGPANALPLMLRLEADRLGWMLETMDSAKVDLQRDVVKNERRQSYENQPYGLAFEHIASAIYPKGHPYSWTTIGSMADLSAASLDDVKGFFRTYYAPNNATIVVAGDVRADSVRVMVRTMFAEIPRGPAFTRPTVAPFTLRDTVVTLEDRVQLPRLYLAWHGVREFSRDDAALDIAAYVLAGARNSRLTKALVQDRPLATSVNAFNASKRLDGDVQIVATARPGVHLDTLQRAIDAELDRLGRGTGLHEEQLAARIEHAVHDTDRTDDSAVLVELAVEDERLKRLVGVALRRRDALDDRVEEIRNTLARLGRDAQDLVGRNAEHPLDFVGVVVGVRGRQVDLVQRRNDLEVVLEREITVRQGLRLDALGRIDDKDDPLTGGE